MNEQDQERLDWLERSHARLQDVYWHVENEGGTVRDAIDLLAVRQAHEKAPQDPYRE